MSRYPILDVCARIEGHEIQRQLLREHCHDFEDWQGLLTQAENEGMTPLLKKHLEESGSIYPKNVRRSLEILYKRHQQQANVRFTVLQELLELFALNKLHPLVIKGAALCYTTYPDPALRPMRDIDLLFRKNEVRHAQKLMRDTGFTPAQAAIPSDHHHLPSLHKRVDSVNICVELHRGLYPDCPPYYPEVDFDKLFSTSNPFKVGNISAATLNDEETLHYIYQHAFRAPLTYETYKLINAADVIGFTEKKFQELNFNWIENQFPLLPKVLPAMHYISPWNFERVSRGFVASKEKNKKRKPLPFVGWPHKRRTVLKTENKTLYQILFDTFLPSKWWLWIYYGETTTRGRLSCLLWRHPRHVLWWARLFFALRKQ